MITERTLRAAAEVGLAAVTLATVAGMHRLFDGGSWAVPLLLSALVAHGSAVVLRRRGLSLGVTAAIMAVLAVLVTTWASYWSTTRFGLPSGTTWTVFQDDLGAAWDLYQDEVSPVPVATGFVVVSSLAIWCIAYVADWAAFRLWVPFESTLPAATLFLFTALLGTQAGRVWSVSLYAASLLGFLLLHRLARQDGSSHWIAERRAAGNRSLLLAGGGLVLVAVTAGSLLSPAIPGAESPGLLDPRDLDGDEEPRRTVSPLVDIRSRLVDQSQVELFTVRSSARSYWRLTSLEQFDGRIWSSSGSYGEADGRLPTAADLDISTAGVEQRYSVSALAAIWLPSAYEPRSFESDDDLSARYDEDSGTLIVDSSHETSDGVAYDVVSASPRLLPADLDATLDDVPSGIRETFTELPADFSTDVRAEAERITAGAANPYEMARALQDHLRGFTYSLEIPEGHSGNDLERFLFETQTGYCEQFAGSFAAMARSVGLPSRVAVGFTPGDEDPNDAGLYRVRGEYAHAWPEVYFPGAGWVAFEPTPGRGMPAAEPYTGVPEQQAAPGQPNQAQVIEVPALPDPDSPGDPEPDQPGDSGTEPDGAGDDPDGEGAGDRSNVERFVEDPLRRIAPFAIAVALLYAIAVPAGTTLSRRRRRSMAHTPAARVAVAWTEAAEDASMAGYRERASDTYPERATAVGRLLPDAATPAMALALARETAEYSIEGAGPAEVDTALRGAAEVGAAARAALPRHRLVLRLFDPRPMLSLWRRDRLMQRRHITTSVATPVESEAESHDEFVGTARPG